MGRGPFGRSWGEPHGPTREQETIRLADALAARVRVFEEWPSMNNRESMLDACSAYEATLR